MFEDSTFESTGRIKTRSRRWMLAALAFNGSILIALVLLPLIYPGALPQHIMLSELVAPPASAPQTPPQLVRAATPHNFSEMMGKQLIAPRLIPKGFSSPTTPERPFNSNLTMDLIAGVPGGDGNNPFGKSRPAAVVYTDNSKPLPVSSRVIDGYAIYKSLPPYPIIAKTAGVQGAVVLQATISKVGTIENLHVISGPLMLQQAAIDAVKTWRYRPFLLNQQPVEVETTVNVIFKLER